MKYYSMNSQEKLLNILEELTRANNIARDILENERNYWCGKGCLSCVNFLYPHCQVAGRVPPDDVIRNGCEQFVRNPDDVPF